MVGSVNKVILLGNLGRDPEIRSMQSGSKMASFSIATSKRWKDKSTQEQKEKTSWHNIVVFGEGLVDIIMTLTSPNCPVAEILPEQVKKAAKKAKGVKDVNLKLVFEPPWNPDMMSEAAKVELNMG